MTVRVTPDPSLEAALDRLLSVGDTSRVRGRSETAYRKCPNVIGSFADFYKIQNFNYCDEVKGARNDHEVRF